ncbi:MAG: anti-sigma-D factor RsdA [Pseudonocardia sp.]
MRDKPSGFDSVFGRRSSAAKVNGVHPEGMHTHAQPIDDVRAEPVDFVAVQADDELISALAVGMAVSAPGVGGYDTDDRVAAMLAAWKADVDAEPIPQLIDIDAATAAVKSGRAPSSNVRYLRPLAGAAALLVFAAAGASIGAQDSRPGDPLWAVSKVLYAEHAESVEALAVVEGAQQKARELLAVGDKDGAAAALEEGKAAATDVLAEDGQGAVVQDLMRLEVAVADTTPGVPNTVEEPAQQQQRQQQPAVTGPTEAPPTGQATKPTEDPRSLSSDPGTPPPPAAADSTTSPPTSTTTPTEPSTGTEGQPAPGNPPSSDSAAAPSGDDLSGASTTASGTATSEGQAPASTTTTTPPPPN